MQHRQGHPSVDVSSTMLAMLAFLVILTIGQIVLGFFGLNPTGRPLEQVLPESELKWIPFFNGVTLLQRSIISFSLPVLILTTYIISPFLAIRRTQHKDVYLDTTIAEKLVTRLAGPLRIARVPRLRIIKSDVSNASLIGVWPLRPTLLITSGLLQSSASAESGAIIAHELSHMANKDMSFMTWAAAFTLGAKYWVAVLVMSSLFGATSGFVIGYVSQVPVSIDPSIIAIFVIIIFGFIGFFYLSSLLITRAISRQREFLADAHASFVVGVEPVASAIKKVARENAVAGLLGGLGDFSFAPAPSVSGVRSLFGSLTSTHPSPRARLQALENGSYKIAPGRRYLPSFRQATLTGLIVGLSYFSLFGWAVLESPQLTGFLFSVMPIFPLSVATAVNYVLVVRHTDFRLIGSTGNREILSMLISLGTRNYISHLAIFTAFSVFVLIGIPQVWPFLVFILVVGAVLSFGIAALEVVPAFSTS